MDTGAVSETGKISSENQYPSSRYAWFMVIMLTLAYILSFVDRYIFGLLVEPIKADFNLTDTQIGLLMGPAFGVVYATMGLPIGWLADRKRRTLIVAAGIALWSAATAATGLAKTFSHIFAARMSVGVGEAALSPVAMSIISDSFEPKSRGKPIAFYTAALTLGAGIASLVAAGVLTWAKTVPQIELPIIGVLAPWQFIFIIVGLPGLILAIIFTLLREPVRIKETDEDVAPALGLRDMLRYVFQRFGAYFGIIAMVGSMLVVVYSQGWMAATFERTWGWSAEKYVFVNAIIMLSLGPLTVNFAGWLSDRLYQKGRRDAPYLIMLVGMCILVPSAIAATLMPSPTLAFVFLAINLVGIALASAVGPTALLNITPSNIRAQVTALYYMIISLLGLMLGPLAVSLLSDYVFGNENLRFAVSTVPLIFGVPALLFGFYARGAYVCELNKIQG
ncbi:MAG: MFS transporter [Pseudomonadales bacterium]